MEIRFYLDPSTGQPHILNHGVEEDEVREVLEAPGEDRRGREGSRVAVGQTSGGRYLRVIYVPDPNRESAFAITAYELERQTSARLPQAHAPEADMRATRFPPGWDESRVRAVLSHYEDQTPEEAVAEDEAAFEDRDETVMTVPRRLVPAVRQLIAKNHR